MKTFLLSLLLFASCISPSAADTPAISGVLKQKCRVKMHASSTTEKKSWTIFVEQVEFQWGDIVPVAQIGVFKFGSVEDPAEYPAQESSVAPVVRDGAMHQYKIAVYFMNNWGSKPILVHYPESNLSNAGFEYREGPDGTPLKMVATHWDKSSDPAAQIHKITLEFECASTPTTNP